MTWELYKVGNIMNLKKPDAVIFDWDGTLVDTLGVILKGYNEIFTQFGMPLWSAEDGRKNIRLSAREVFPRLFGARSEEALTIFYDAIEKYHLTHLKKMNGAEEFLSYLHHHLKIPLGIVSNKRDAYLKAEVEYLGWDRFFSGAVGAGRAAQDKPAPECMLLAVDEMGLPQGSLELWYVGDTETDMEFAANAGCKKVFISHGFGTLAEAEKYRPDYTVSSLADLGKELDTIFNLR